MMRIAYGLLAALTTLSIAQARAQVTPILPGVPLTSAHLNQNFNSVLWLNKLTVAGSCTGTSAANGQGASVVTIKCPSPTGLPSIANNTIMGNVIGSTALPTGLTGAQITNLLTPFNATTQGVVGPSGGGTANFLRADGLWAVPPGTGAGGGVVSSNAGTVTSVNVNGGSTGLNFTGGPVTGSGTITAGGTLGVANGGTGATTVAGVKTAFGLSTVATTGAYTDLSGVPTLGTMAVRTAPTNAPLTGFDASGNPVNVALGNGFSMTTNGSAAILNYSGAALTVPNSALLGGNGTGLLPVTVGSGLALTGGTLSSTSGGGSVTSVAASGGTTGMAFTGGPITGAGTLTLTGILTQAAGGTGATSAAGAKSALAIACTDLTNDGTACTKNASGTGATVASTSGTFVIGHEIVAADTAGTIKDNGTIPLTAPNSSLVGGNGTVLTAVTLGSGLSLTSGILTATGSGGGVTASVRLVGSGTTDTSSDTAGIQTIKWTSTSVGSKSEVLPVCAAGNKGQIFNIKDGANTAATYPITLTANSSTFDYAVSASLATNRGSLSFQCDGSGDWSKI